MLKSQHYYYEDVIFQLDLNLQTIRRELIDLLEEYPHDCNHCKQLKCSCLKNKPRGNLFSLFQHNIQGFSPSMSLRLPPPAYSLPKPEWTIDNSTGITKPKAGNKSWVRNSKAENKYSKFKIISIEENCTWPPFPKSIWSEESKMTSEGDNSDAESVSSVEAFFKHFSDRSSSKNSSRS